VFHRNTSQPAYHPHIHLRSFGGGVELDNNGRAEFVAGRTPKNCVFVRAWARNQNLQSETAPTNSRNRVTMPESDSCGLEKKFVVESNPFGHESRH